jgi:hypothetical protein
MEETGALLERRQTNRRVFEYVLAALCVALVLFAAGALIAVWVKLYSI